MSENLNLRAEATREDTVNTNYLRTHGETKEPPVTNQELLQKYRVEIGFMTEGCLIHVGCKQFAFSSIKEAMKALNKYVKNPAVYHKQWDK